MVDKYQRVDFRDQISRNKLSSFFLMAIIFIIFVLLGYVISFAFNPSLFFVIMIFSIIISLTYILISYYNSDKIAIASVGAVQAKRSDYKDYYNLVEGLTIASSLPMPKLYVMHSPQINAFASGRNPKNAVVCVTDGALEKLEKRELEGVLAHELSHVGNYDIRYLTIVAVMVGMIAIVSEIFLRSLWFKSGGNDNSKGNAIFVLIGVLLAVLAPIIVHLVQLAISRKREYSADASAVKFTRYPDGLIGALEKIKGENKIPDKKVPKVISSLMFVSPAELLSTHPDINKRIEVLKRM